LTASTTSPADGETDVTLTPTFTGTTYSIGTLAYGGTDIANASTGKTAIPVQSSGSGYTTATTYYMQVTNAAGDTFNVGTVTITPLPVEMHGPAEGTPFGSLAVGATSAPQTITFTFTSGGVVAGAPVVVTQGATSLDFADVTSSKGTCDTNGTSHSYSISDTCTMKVTFTPSLPGIRYGAVLLEDGSGNVLATANLYGVGVGPEINYLPYVSSTLTSTLTSPGAIVMDPSGNIFGADSGTGIVYERLTNGTVNTLASVSGVSAVTLDNAGNLYYGDPNTGKVQEILKTGGYTTTQTVVSGFTTPAGLAVDGNGDVFVADNANGQIHEVVAVNGVIPASPTKNRLAATTTFSDLHGLALDASGNLYVAGGFDYTVYQVTAASSYASVITMASGGGNNLFAPQNLAVDSNGNIYVVDLSVSLLEIPAGCTTPCNATSLISSFSQTQGVALDGLGNIYVADKTGGATSTITKLDAADAPTVTFLSTAVGSTSSDSPKSVTVQNYGNATLTFTASGLTAPTDFTQVAGGGSPVDCVASGSVAASSTCNLSIDFVPTVTGSPLSESFGLTDNNLNVTNATQSITLTGVATTGSASGASIPVVTITPVGTFTAVTNNTTGTIGAYTAGNAASFTSAPTDHDSTYVCTLDNGNFPGSTMTASGTITGITTTLPNFTELGSGSEELSCTITNLASASGTAGTASATAEGLSTIAVSPKNLYVAPGASLNYTATGSFTGGFTADLSGVVAWTATDVTGTSVASFTSGDSVTAGSGVGVSAIEANVVAASVSHTTDLMVGAWTASAHGLTDGRYQALPMLTLSNGTNNILWLAGGIDGSGVAEGDDIDSLASGYSASTLWTNSPLINNGNTPTGGTSYTLSNPHLNGTATLAGTGQVIITGGDTGGGTPTANDTIEVFNPTLNTSSSPYTPDYTVSTQVIGGVSPQVTTQQVAALLTAGINSGDVLIAGGWDAGTGPTYYPYVYLYTPSLTTDSLTTSRSQLGVARYESTATTLNDGRVLIAGGVDGFVGVDNTVDIYDSINDLSDTTGSNAYLTANANASVALYNFSNEGGGSATHDAMVWAQCSNWLSSMASTSSIYNPCLNVARTGHTATLLGNGKVLIAGGTGDGSTAISSGSLEIFDPTLNSGAGGFYSLGALSTARFGHSAVYLGDGLVLIFGGTDGTYALNSAEVVDTNATVTAGVVAHTDGWTTSPVGNLNVYRQTPASVLLPTNLVLAAGGNSGDSSTHVTSTATPEATVEVFGPAAP